MQNTQVLTGRVSIILQITQFLKTIALKSLKHVFKYAWEGLGGVCVEMPNVSDFDL